MLLKLKKKTLRQYLHGMNKKNVKSNVYYDCCQVLVGPDKK